MQSVGARLREARTTRAMSLEDVSQITKIPSASLQAIETDQFGLLPAPIFVRGFVRSYAQAVGLDPGELVRQLPPEVAKNVRTVEKSAAARNDLALAGLDEQGGGMWRRSSMVLLFVMALGMFLTAWLMAGNKPGADDRTAKDNPPAIQERVDGVSSFSDANSAR